MFAGSCSLVQFVEGQYNCHIKNISHENTTSAQSLLCHNANQKDSVNKDHLKKEGNTQQILAQTCINQQPKQTAKIRQSARLAGKQDQIKLWQIGIKHTKKKNNKKKFDENLQSENKEKSVNESCTKNIDDDQDNKANIVTTELENDTESPNLDKLQSHITTENVNELQIAESLMSVELKSEQESEDDVEQCPECFQEFPSANLQQHFDDEHTSYEADTDHNYFKCCKCDREYATEKTLQQHDCKVVAKHSAESIKQAHTCPKCHIGFDSSNSRKQHIRRIHHNDAELLTSLLPPKKHAKYKMKCPICNEEFIGKRILRHLEQKHSEEERLHDIYGTVQKEYFKLAS